ncbi:unnamed protein product, partial [Rotaria sp. Silwood1]
HLDKLIDYVEHISFIVIDD